MSAVVWKIIGTRVTQTPMPNTVSEITYEARLGDKARQGMIPIDPPTDEHAFVGFDALDEESMLAWVFTKVSKEATEDILAREVGLEARVLPWAPPEDQNPDDLTWQRSRLKARVTAQADKLIAGRYTREQEVNLQRRYRQIVEKLFAVREGASAELTADEWAELDTIGVSAAYSEAVMAAAATKRAEIDALETVEACEGYDVTAGWPQAA